MGRTKSFDPEEVLSRAVQVFWQFGYENTSVADLEKALDINKFSLYQTFGNKHDLYIKALDSYIDVRFTPLLSLLQSHEPSGLTAIGLFFDTLKLVLESQPEKIGCFVAAAGTERSGMDAAVRQRVQWVYGQLEDGFYHCLEQALRQGKIAPDTPLQDRARFLLVQSQGLLVVARNQQDIRTITSTHAVIKELLDQWQVAPE